MRSPVTKRSIVLAGHKTSVSLEDSFWTSLKEIAREKHMKVPELLASIDTQRLQPNLSSAIRVFVLDYYRRRLSAEVGDQDRFESKFPPRIQTGVEG